MSICSEHNKVNCGCQSALTTPPACPTPEECPDVQPCSYSIDTTCVVYTGDPITCGSVIIADTDTNLTDILENVAEAICDNVGSTVVVEGTDIDVQSTTVDNVTTYTVSTAAPLLRKFVKDFTSIFDGDVLTILGSELTACGFLTQGCGENNTEIIDFTYAIYYFLEGELTPGEGDWISISNQNNVTVSRNTTTNDVKIALGISPISPAVPVRVVIIG